MTHETAGEQVTMNRRLILISSLVLAGSPAFAAAIKVGPAVGSKAPPISATTLDGKAVSIASMAGSKGLVLVFFRSAEWCPFCKAQLIGFNDAPAKLASRGYKLAALSYDSPEILAKFRDERAIGYKLLSDGNSKTITDWGLRDPQYKPDSRAYGVPQPVIIVISAKGMIEASLAEEGYKTRPPLDLVLATIDALPRR
jgi:peroxiredoxin